MTHPNLSDEQLKPRLTEAFPAGEPSPQLRSRIESLVTVSAREAYWKEKGRKAFLPAAILMGGALLVEFLVGFYAFSPDFLPPSQGSERILESMNNVMMKARSEHIAIYDVHPNGQRIKKGDVWFQDGKERVNIYQSGMTETHLFRDGKLWVYTPSDNTLVIQRQLQPLNVPTSTFAFTDGLKSSEFGQDPIFEDLGDAIVSGRFSRQIAVIVNPTMRFIFSVNPSNELPFHKELQRKLGERWVTRATWDYEYNVTLPDTLFVPDFPKNATTIDNSQTPQNPGAV